MAYRVTGGKRVHRIKSCVALKNSKNIKKSKAKVTCKSCKRSGAGTTTPRRGTKPRGVASLIFSRKKGWTVAGAQKWLKSHDYKAVRKTHRADGKRFPAGEYHFPQFDYKKSPGGTIKGSEYWTGHDDGTPRKIRVLYA
jgi:hypothetical protein